MAQRASRFVTLVVMLALCSGVAGAEDEPAAPAEPSPLAEPTDEQLTEAGQPADPIAYLKSFRDWLAGHETPPPRTRVDTALWDIWRAALYPRATRMRKRVENLMERRHWLPEVGAPQRVKPTSWSPFVRDIAALMTELAGALKQYESARIKIHAGIPRERVRSYASYYGYAYPYAVWRRVVLRRYSLLGSVGPGLHVRPAELHSYWNLLRRFQAGWEWRLGRCIECEKKREEAQRKKVEDYIAERQKLFDTTRDTLQQQMLSLQLLVATMQAQEEHELGQALEKLPGSPGDARGTQEGDLGVMHGVRIEGEQFTGDSAAAYGSILRRWLRVYKQVVERLDGSAASDD